MKSGHSNLIEAESVPPANGEWPEGLAARLKFYQLHRNGLTLRVALATAAAHDPRGTIILSPGRTEFIEKYYETLGDLTARGFTVLVVEPRGQGLSQRLLEDPLICHTDKFQDFADDFSYAFSQLQPLLPKPYIAMGHSMGGTIVLQSVLSGQLNPSAIICAAPMLGLFDLETPIIAWVIRGLAVMGLRTKPLPFRPQKDGMPLSFNINKLTSDKTRYERWADFFMRDPRLCLGPPSLGWISQSMQVMASLHRNAANLKIPTLIVAAGGDPIVDPASNREFAEKSGARFHIVPGSLHELMMERDEYRDQFFDILDDFLKENAF